jgi:hypothetical protein
MEENETRLGPPEYGCEDSGRMRAIREKEARAASMTSSQTSRPERMEPGRSVIGGLSPVILKKLYANVTDFPHPTRAVAS